MGRNIYSNRHRQIGAATEKIAEGRKRGRACSCGKKYLQIDTVGTSTEEIAHRGGEGREGVQL